MSEPAIASPLLGASAGVAPLGHFGRAVLRCREAQVAQASKRLGVELPRDACRSVKSGELSALWLGPDEWLLMQPLAGGDWAGQLAARLGDTLCSLADVSHRQVALGVFGDRAKDILASGCALDLSLTAFPLGACTRTMFAKAEVVLWRTGVESFHLEVWRSFARYAEALLREAENEA